MPVLQKTIQLLLLCLLTQWSLSAQLTIRGTVSFADEASPEGTIVRLLESDSTTMLDFASVGQDGTWKITSSGDFPLILEASFFGYKTQYITLSDAESIPEEIQITMTPQNFNLEEVTVKDKAIGVTRVGDTLTFNLTTFTTGSERTLSDVIDRLPGMEIRDGSVYYGGELIGRMLVQGRDIINSNQKLATEGIRADQLQEIKIIENYRVDGEEFESTQSDQVAMDVRLKESELNKWSGQAELLGGYPSSAKGDINAFNLNDKVGLSGFIRGNNVGQEVLTFQDVMNMLDASRGMRYRVSSSTWNQLIPPSLNIGDQVQSNLDGVASLNLDWEVNDQLNIKGFLTAAYAERESEVNSITEYIAEKQTREEQSTSSSETPLVNSMWRAQWKPDTNTFLDVTLPMSYNTSETTTDQVGRFESTPFETNNLRDEDNFYISPSAKYRKKFGVNTLFVDASFSRVQGNLDRRFQDLFSFLGVSIDPTDSLFSVQQDRQQRVTEFKAVSSFKKVMGDWFVEPSIEYGFLDEDVDFEADKSGVVAFGLDDALTRNTVIYGLRGGYETDDWEFVPRIALNTLDRDFELEQDHNETFMTYGLEVVRKFNRAHRLRLSASYDLSFPELNNVWGVNNINSATNISTGAYPADLATKGYNASVSYRNYAPAKNMFYFTRISYQRREEVLSTFTQSFDSYILQGFIPTDFENQVSGSFYMGFELPFAPIRLQPGLSINWSDGFSTNRSETIPTENLSQSYNFGIRSRWEFPLNVYLDFGYRTNKVTSRGVEGRSFDAWSADVGLDYSFDQWTLASDFGYQLTESGVISRELLLWDFDISYEIKNTPLTMRVQAENILNITPREQVNNGFSINTATISTYDIFPGFILGGFSWNF